MSFSVLMSVYKKENPEYFERALKSTWNEQILKPNEIVLVQDGKLTKILYEIINKWKDIIKDRLIVVDLKDNVGFAKALNEGLKYCSCEFIARMDTDDISLPNRFEKQIKFMENNKDVAVCGSYIGEFETNNTTTKRIEYPIEFNEIKKYIKLRNPLAHPTVIIRKDVLMAVKGYPNFRLGQDFALWSLLISENYKILNIPEVLLDFRVNKNLLKRRSLEDFKYMYQIYMYQHKLGIINKFELLRNIGLKLIINLSPIFIKNIIYKIK